MDHCGQRLLPDDPTPSDKESAMPLTFAPLVIIIGTAVVKKLNTPQTRQVIVDTLKKLDTPENRQRAAKAVLLPVAKKLDSTGHDNNRNHYE
jgi:hypothetical protein